MRSLRIQTLVGVGKSFAVSLHPDVCIDFDSMKSVGRLSKLHELSSSGFRLQLSATPWSLIGLKPHIVVLPNIEFWFHLIETYRADILEDYPVSHLLRRYDELLNLHLEDPAIKLLHSRDDYLSDLVPTLS